MALHVGEPRWGLCPRGPVSCLPAGPTVSAQLGKRSPLFTGMARGDVSTPKKEGDEKDSGGCEGLWGRCLCWWQGRPVLQPLALLIG